MNTTESKGTLLIVDDIPDNVTVLLNFLSQAGFEVLIAQDGEESIQITEYAHPDLILLDIMMPNMDGFEVCRRLKSSEKTQEIPIIFMTALTNTVDKVEGFELGAADYITKPFQQEEVLARVTTHLKIHKLQQQLRVQNQQLQDEISIRKQVEESLRYTSRTLAKHTAKLEEQAIQLEERTAELEERNLELDAFARTVAYDLKNPLSAIIDATDVLLEDCVPDQPLEPDSIDKLQFVAQSAEKMLNIINALLLLAGVYQQKQVEMHPLDMPNIVNQVILQRINYLLNQHRGEINLPSSWPVAKGYAPWVKELWVNYLSNALKYGGQPPRLELGATMQQEGIIRFWVRDNGEGLSSEARAQLFTPFTNLQAKSVDSATSGLGLSIVKHIVEKLGGEVGVESEIGQGSLFYFTLPAYLDEL